MLNKLVPAIVASNIWKICLIPIVLLLLYKTYLRSLSARRNRQKAASLGCLSAPHGRTYLPYGLDHLYKIYRDAKAKKLLEMGPLFLESVRPGCKTVGLSLLGKDIVYTVEPENVKCILATKFKDFQLSQERHDVLAPLIGEGIFVANGEAWKHSRELLRPAFERARIDDPAMFEQHAASLISAIPTDGTPIDLVPLFYSLSLDVATEFLFGQSTGCLARLSEKKGERTEAEDFADAYQHLVTNMDGMDSGWGFLGMFLPDPHRKKNIKTVHSFVDNIVAKAIAEEDSNAAADEKAQHNGSDKGTYNFLQELLRSMRDPIRLRGELLNILLAGRDTSASLLANIFFTLSQNPAIYHRLEEEVLTAFPLPNPNSPTSDSQNPTFSSLKSLPYLRAIINESLRLYPIVPENSREAARDTTIPLGGGPDGKSPVFVPKGYQVAWGLYGMQRRTDLYGADAAEFKPERWLDGEDGKGLRVGWEFVPFNGGPRICIGQQFALMETSYVLVKIIRSFEAMEPVEKGRVWTERFVLTCAVDGGVKVTMRPRGQRA